MKKSTLLLLSLILSLGACTKTTSSAMRVNRAANNNTEERKVIDFDSLEANDYVETPTNQDEIGSFDLISPFNNQVLEQLGTFTWEAATNADKYTIEISSSPEFIAGLATVDYYKQPNIYATSWTPSVNLIYQNADYYWRVTAVNGSGNPVVSEVSTFRMVAPEVEEFQLDLGEADDWQLHPTGSYADIGIDNSNFFGNDEESVVVSFKKEDTMRGIPESDGWIVVTKTIEKSIYGTDALFFNLYYAGQDADIFIRLIDRDNEFWVCPVQVSNNAKQSVILQFDDFVQRTKDVTVGNRVFDHERIKYFEIVFERSFGDGMLLLSNVKAIKFSNYSNFFIDKLNFLEYPVEAWKNDSYQFEKEFDEDELTIKYWGPNDLGKPSINSIGYGFVKLAVNRYFSKGDCVKMKFKYTGNKGNNLVLRIYEEDTDRWFYRVPYSSLDVGEYQELVIPFEAFGDSSMQGDARRQFYYVIELQFGIEGQYGTGTASFKDFEIVKKADYQDETTRVVDASGMIEDFSRYNSNNEIFMIWNVSDKNKEEYISLNSVNKMGGSDNKYCGQFEYKADMDPAQYYLPISTTGTFGSFSLLLKDASVKDGDAKVGYLESVNADMTIYIELKTTEIYSYHIPVLDKAWYQYTLPFDSFDCANIDYLPFAPHPITAEGVDRIGFSFQYYYYDSLGNPCPRYTNDNKVYIDNICFGNATEFSKVLKEKIIHMDGDIATVDDFEGYATDDDINDAWVNGESYPYQNIALSNNVSSEGGSKSMSLEFKSNSNSPKYYLAPAVDKDVKGRVVRFSLYCDKPATVYFNLYFEISGSTLQYRATLDTVNVNEWTEYTIGISNNNFVKQGDGNGVTLNANYVKYVSRISFGMVYYDGLYGTYHLLVDNIHFDNTSGLSYDTNTRRVIDAEQEV